MDSRLDQQALDPVFSLMLCVSLAAGSGFQVGALGPCCLVGVCGLEEPLTISLASPPWGAQLLPATCHSHLELGAAFLAMVSSTLDWPLPELQHLVTAVPRAAKTSVHLNLEGPWCSAQSHFSIPARKTVPTGTVACSWSPFPVLGLLSLIPSLVTAS